MRPILELTEDLRDGGDRDDKGTILVRVRTEDEQGNDGFVDGGRRRGDSGQGRLFRVRGRRSLLVGFFFLFW